MAREKKPIEVRPVEEDVFREQEIVRLEKDARVVKVVKERVAVRPAPGGRLAVPEVSGADAKRTHEPGVEVLYDGEAAMLNVEESQWGGEAATRRPLPWGWFAVLGLVLTGAVVWSVTRMMAAKPEVEEVRQQAKAKELAEEVTDQEIERSLERMGLAVRRFCEAGTVAEMAKWVRQPERVRPLMEHYYAQHPLEPFGYQRQSDFQGALFGTANNFWVVRPVIGTGKLKALLVEETGDDFRVDWETAVTYQPMAWDSYAVDRPKGGTLDFRVKVERDNFFSHEFADPNKYSSYRLTTPGSEQPLWGYAEKNSEAESIINESLQKNPDPRRPVSLILRLGLPAELRSRRGVIIEKVLSTRWIYLTPPDPAGQ